MFQTPKWNEIGRMCWLCMAVGENGSPLQYTCTGSDAPWRPTRVTHQAYLAWLRSNDLEIPAWFRHIKGLQIICLMIDILHSTDLGVFAHVIGNIFWECIKRHIWGPNIKANIAGIQRELKLYYTALRIKNRFTGKLTEDMIRTSKGWPILKCKGAPIRAMDRFALQLAEAHLDHRHVLLCKMMVRFNEIVSQQPMFLDADAKREIGLLGVRFCDLYGAMSVNASERREKLWKFPPKLHAFEHLCEWQAVEWANPRFFWTYADEDFVDKMILVAELCHPSTLELTATWNWLLGGCLADM